MRGRLQGIAKLLEDQAVPRKVFHLNSEYLKLVSGWSVEVERFEASVNLLIRASLF
jgi:hypothetical protein